MPVVQLPWEYRYAMIRKITCSRCGGSGKFLILHLDGTVEEEECDHWELRRLLRRLLFMPIAD